MYPQGNRDQRDQRDQRKQGGQEVYFRIGLGTDIHALVPKRKLILGGIEIPHSKGLKGHSDADAVAHATIDAILGAMGESDIGELFPDHEEQYKDASSMLLLEDVIQTMKDKQFRVSNLDIVIHAEEPKLTEYKMPIRENLAKAFDVNIQQVSVKAKTQEGFGAVGKKEAISVQAIILLRKYVQRKRWNNNHKNDNHGNKNFRQDFRGRNKQFQGNYNEGRSQMMGNTKWPSTRER